MISVQQQLVKQLAKAFPEALFYKPTDAKVVALTLDDVPTPDDPDDASTQLILDAIAAQSAAPVRATFFVISSHLSADSGILERIVQAGHEIGNHGVLDTAHADLNPTVFETQLWQAHQRLVTPHQPRIRWYRPGRGRYRSSMLKAITRLGEAEGYEMKLALASVLPLDTFKGLNAPQFTTWYVSQFVFPGAVLVLHGGSKQRCQNTAQVLRQLLPALSQRGYQVVTLSQLWDQA
jgi:peptidoglycan/xylan/chitin deacetylase (PgdA/CDA1 family)